MQPLDAVGPLEVFNVANRLFMREHPGRSAAYALELLASRAGPIDTPAGYALHARRGYPQFRGQIDTLIVPGGQAAREGSHGAGLIRFVARHATRARRVCSVCTGALILARAGVLDGRRATTHWAACELLAREYPRVRVERDPIFVRDGQVYTSAGVLAGVDLALALVEADLGARIALEAARWLVAFLKRPGGQSQFSAHLESTALPAAPFRELAVHVAEHPDADLSVSTLAARVGMSPRNFARRFQAELGTTPGGYINRARLEAARRRLETGDQGLEEIAAATGFGSAETMRRAFQRMLQVNPSDYRGRFAGSFAPADPASG